jgi:prevent-host-death family protein
MWAIQDAKNKLSQVVELALTQGEQEITVRGKEAVTVISTGELRRLRGHPQSVVEFLSVAPIASLIPHIFNRD